MAETKYIISDKVLNKMVGYLGSRPYHEVAEIIAEVSRDIRPANEFPQAPIIEHKPDGVPVPVE